MLTVGLFGVIQMFHFGLDKTKSLQEGILAVRAATNEMESLAMVSFDELDVGEAQAFRSSTPEFERLINATSEVDIVDRSKDGSALKRITVRVYWTGENGRTIRKTLTTLRANL